MSPPEWLGVLLQARREGMQVTGIDIVDPKRVRTRFLPELVEDVLAVPVVVGDILVYDSPVSHYDLITCVSTLEHIGFDVATPSHVTDSVFSRALTAEEAQAQRAADTDKRFLDAAHRLLNAGGRLLLTVPVGANRPILHQDSLGLFTYQFEYGQEPWEAIMNDDRFTVTDEAYFRWTAGQGWGQVGAVTDLTDQTSELQPYAVGCACAELTRK